MAAVDADLYTYVGNNPVNYVDPTGHRRDDDYGGGSFGGSGGLLWDQAMSGLDRTLFGTSFSSGTGVSYAELQAMSRDMAVAESRAEKRYYRAVKSIPPTEEDFKSNAALGKKPRGAEIDNPELHSGLSVWDDEAVALSKAEMIPGSKGVAVLEVPEGVGTLEKTLKHPNHYTWWVEPEVGLGTVTGIITPE